MANAFANIHKSYRTFVSIRQYSYTTKVRMKFQHSRGFFAPKLDFFLNIRMTVSLTSSMKFS